MICLSPSFFPAARKLLGGCFDQFRLLFGKSALVLLLLVGFSSCTGLFQQQEYGHPATYPKNPQDVVVKVSLQRQMIYVMEGGKPLLVTPCCVGIPSHPTPKGRFHVTRKERNKRSGSYGFSIEKNGIRPAKVSDAKGRYVGYPMPYWVEFLPGYGFHMGCVWPMPRSHGCIRIHPNDAGKFFEIVLVGATVDIQECQPEDKTLGARCQRPTDFAKPDPDSRYMISEVYFKELPPVVVQPPTS